MSAPAGVGRAPGEERQGGEQRDGHGPGEKGEPDDDAGRQPAPPLGEREGRDAQEEVERLAIDGLEEERHRANGEIEDGAAGALGSQPWLGEPVEQDEGAEAGGERNGDPREDVVAEEDSSDDADDRGIQREERRGRSREVLVAVLGDAQEEDAVPARPDVGERAEVAGDGRVVPAGCFGMPVRLEDQEREERSRPDRRATPEEDLDGWAARRPDGQVTRLDSGLAKPLTCAHDGGDHTGVAPPYFTPDEANRALEVVRPLTAELVEHRRALVELQERQTALTARIAGNGGDLEPRELQDVQESLDEEVAGIARCVARIHEAGGLVKDLDAGLVDFPARREGEDVLLCWRLGEDEVGHWHGLEEGFSGRRELPF